MDLRKWYDGVNAEMVPAGADGYMGYIDGLYRSFEDLKLKFPLAKHLAIAVNPADNANRVTRLGIILLKLRLLSWRRGCFIAL
jgi:hypothetical protein